MKSRKQISFDLQTLLVFFSLRKRSCIFPSFGGEKMNDKTGKAYILIENDVYNLEMLAFDTDQTVTPQNDSLSHSLFLIKKIRNSSLHLEKSFSLSSNPIELTSFWWIMREMHFLMQRIHLQLTFWFGWRHNG